MVPAAPVGRRARRSGAVAVRVRSREDPEGVGVEESILEISHFVDAFAELSPRTSRGRRMASHDLSFNNRGNSRVESKVTAADPDKLLSFVVSRPPWARSGARPRSPGCG